MVMISGDSCMSLGTETLSCSLFLTLYPHLAGELILVSCDEFLNPRLVKTELPFDSQK